ncbi:MAG: hypothetical protein KDD41_06920 [Flavobacteriales bacterium]|nr:hypothetical protein [Flavobacteriales bacterium]
MKRLLVILAIFQALNGLGQFKDYPYLKNKTYTYEETCELYRLLANKYEAANLQSVGVSDAGKPIYLFTISMDGDFSPQSNKQKGKASLLINNAIHPGEPCGVDACVKLAYDLLSNQKHQEMLKQTVVYIIPFYNVGGGLNRGCCSRANQNGPEEYGFRGNVKNRDLNRDFIKCDTRNAITFTQIFHMCDPDIFMDTHTTNGSDHQYTMTLIASQPDKMNRFIRNYTRNVMLPYLYDDMKLKNMEMIPYVYNYKKTPDQGIKDYLDTPRYSTGFATLFNTISMVSEALKYKPYQDRVEQTYELLMTLLKFMQGNRESLLSERQQAIESVMQQKTFELGWYLDTTSYSQLEFNGYEAEFKPSAFGENEKVLTYNHKKPYTKRINYYNRYTSTYEVDKPVAYVIPQAYEDVINRLLWNKVKMKKLPKDTLMQGEVYFIEKYKTVEQPYEGHYMHYAVQLRKETRGIQYYQGDYIVFVDQPVNRYIVETLEPQGMDSFFAWNFFDGVLEQKEWFSPFSFEETATELLKKDKSLKTKFETEKKEDPEFAKSRDKQLYFIYVNSPYYEDTHNMYPVLRLVD